MMLWDLFDFFTLGMFGAYIWAAFFLPRWVLRGWVEVFFHAYFCLAFVLMAVHQIIDGELPAACFDGMGAGWFAWRLWTDDEFRRRRRRLLERGSGVVRDIGGRLKIVPAGSR